MIQRVCSNLRKIEKSTKPKNYKYKFILNPIKPGGIQYSHINGGEDLDGIGTFLDLFFHKCQEFRRKRMPKGVYSNIN